MDTLPEIIAHLENIAGDLRRHAHQREQLELDDDAQDITDAVSRIEIAIALLQPCAIPSDRRAKAWYAADCPPLLGYTPPMR
jgi:hypothetical protein